MIEIYRNIKSIWSSY